MPPEVAAAVSTLAPIIPGLLTTVAPGLSSTVVGAVNNAMTNVVQNATSAVSSMGNALKGVVGSGAAAATAGATTITDSATEITKGASLPTPPPVATVPPPPALPGVMGSNQNACEVSAEEQAALDKENARIEKCIAEHGGSEQARDECSKKDEGMLPDVAKPFIIPIIGLVVGAAMMQVESVAMWGKLVLYF